MSEKYIIVETLGHPVPILFSTLIDHSIFLECYHKDLIISAGIFAIYNHHCNPSYFRVNTHRKSTTLEIESHPEDKDIIEKFLNQ